MRLLAYAPPQGQGGGSSFSGSITKSQISDFPIVNADVAALAAIAYSKLNLSTSIVNADIAAGAAIAKSKLAALGIVNTDVDGAAAIAYSKLNLTTSVVDNDIAVAAAIAWSKISKTSSILDDIGDVVISSIADNQALTWDAGTSRWVNETVSALGVSASGVAVKTGNASTTVFTIAHGLSGIPDFVSVEAASAEALGEFSITKDATNITITYAVPPPSGTNNLSFEWGVGNRALTSNTSGINAGGTATKTGDGATLAFTIAHGMGGIPDFVTVEPANAAARGDFILTKDATNITVTYPIAPAVGTLLYEWGAAFVSAAPSGFTASSTHTLTGKTYDAEGTGNVLSNITNAHIKSSAAIAKSKLAALALVNADVDAAAAIDWTKINKAGQFLFGQSTQSGDGTTAIFNIAHGMGAAPTSVIVIPALAEARGNYFATKDATNIIITYPIAPPNGASNLSWFWMAIR